MVEAVAAPADMGAGHRASRIVARRLMSLFDKQRALYEAVRSQMDSSCPAGEPLVGAIISAAAKFFGNDLYGVGVTADRLMLQPLDKKQRAIGEPTWLTRAEILNCAIWGHGGGVTEWLAHNSEYELRFQTATDHYKLLALGGRTMARAMGNDYLNGLGAVAGWLASCQRR